MSIFSALYNGSDREIVKAAEARASGFWARYPMQRPEEAMTKGAPCKLVLQYKGARDEISRDLHLTEELQYICPEQPESGGETAHAPMGLYASATVKQYLEKYPEDAASFGLNVYRRDPTKSDIAALPKNFITNEDGEVDENAVNILFGTFRLESERETLKKNLVQYLEENPEVGHRLGDKALAFRIQAIRKNLKKIDNEYKKLLEKLPELKKRKENGFPLWARAYDSIRHGMIRSLWWVRDHPILISAVVSLLVLLKIGFELFLIEQIESDHHKKKNAAPPLQSQPARAYRPQPPPYPAQAWSQPSYPQQNYPQPYYSPPAYSPQPPVFPAPYFEQTPTPLQTALNMPTS